MDISPLLISLETASVATLITFFLGIGAAALVTGAKRGKSLFDVLFSLPLVLPPTVVGFLLLILFGRNTPVGSFLTDIGINVIFTRTGAVIAAFVVAFPIVYRTARGAFQQIDMELVDVARTIGIGKKDMLFKVMLPLSWPSLVSGAVLAFARSLGEFGATIMVAGNIPGRTRTMSIAVYNAMQSGNREAAYTWVVIMLLISFVVLLLINLMASCGYRTD